MNHSDYKQYYYYDTQVHTNKDYLLYWLTDVNVTVTSWQVQPGAEIWVWISCLSQTPTLTEPGGVRVQGSEVKHRVGVRGKPFRHSCDISQLQISQLL